MKRWYTSRKQAEADAARENCVIVSGRNSMRDIYYLVPRDAERGKIYRTISRSTGELHGREFMSRVIYKRLDGCVIVCEQASAYRISRVRAGDIPDALVADYLNGYYSLAEEHSATIRARKERARISHELCDASGAAGHRVRQEIRRELAAKQK